MKNQLGECCFCHRPVNLEYARMYNGQPAHTTCWTAERPIEYELTCPRCHEPVLVRQDGQTWHNLQGQVMHKDCCRALSIELAEADIVKDCIFVNNSNHGMAVAENNIVVACETYSFCRGCGAQLKAENYILCDGCPCNSSRGVNHGLVPAHVCTCPECDPEATGYVRQPKQKSSAPCPNHYVGLNSQCEVCGRSE